MGLLLCNLPNRKRKLLLLSVVVVVVEWPPDYLGIILEGLTERQVKAID